MYQHPRNINLLQYTDTQIRSCILQHKIEFRILLTEIILTLDLNIIPKLDFDQSLNNLPIANVPIGKGIDIISDGPCEDERCRVHIHHMLCYIYITIVKYISCRCA